MNNWKDSIMQKQFSVVAEPDAQKSDRLPQRSDIPIEKTWKLDDIFPSAAAWETERAAISTDLSKAAHFQGKLSESPATVWQCLELRSDISRRVFSLYQFAHLSRDSDSRVNEPQVMVQQAALLGSQAQAAFSFVEPELLTLSDETLRSYAKQFPKTDVYDFFIEELIRSKSHVRSIEVEELLAQSAVIARGPDSVFGMFDDADIDYPEIEDEKGRPYKLSKERYSLLMESPNRTMRERAQVAFYEPYIAHRNTLAATLTASVNQDKFYAEARRFGSCLERSLDGDNIPLSVYHALIEAAEKNAQVLHRYLKVRKAILKVDTLRVFDCSCPLFPEQDFKVSWDEAIENVLRSASRLGSEYAAALEHAFKSRWIDVFETEGKSGGAYNWGNYSVHPFVLMNYNDTVDAMFTLAHEMGHAMHSFFSNKTQPYPKSHYSIFVAEVASTLNEALLLDMMLKDPAHANRRAYLLNRSIDNTFGTFFNQTMYARFELFTHETIEKGGALTADSMTEKWLELSSQYYGPALDTSDKAAGYKWARIPHFYNAFYVYQYATSYAASQAIAEMITGGDTTIIPRYLKLLSSGGRTHPIDLLKECGVDMTTSAAVDATIRRFDQQVTELAKIAGVTV